MRLALALGLLGLCGIGAARAGAAPVGAQGAAPVGAQGKAASPTATFAALLREAQDGVAALLVRYPRRADLMSVDRQLGQVALWTERGHRPPQAQVRRLSFGTIAAKEIEPLDRLLGRKLEALAYFLAHWPADPAGPARPPAGGVVPASAGG